MARNLIETFERLKVLLETETSALRNGTYLNLAANADSKARILLELSHWRTLDNDLALSKEQANQLIDLLNENAQMLDQHMKAAKKVSDSLAQHLRDADSDGTYRAAYGGSRGIYRS
ncbi:MAG: hypothetical protein ACRCT6_05940 [Notoacmeibacter sp.]